MNHKSPITKYIIEPFDQFVNNKNIIKYNNLELLQTSFFVLSLAIYYYFENMNERAGCLYFLCYFIYYKYLKLLKNNDLKFVSELSYFVVNIFIVTYILQNSQYDISTSIIILTFLLLTFISYTLQFNNTQLSEDKKINDWKLLLNQTCKNIYPNNDITKIEYTVDSRDVIEFYDAKDHLVGVYFDDTQIELKQLRWVENNKSIQKLLDKHTTEYALAKYFDIPRNGMTKDDVFDLFGEAHDVKYSIDGYDQLTSCNINGVLVVFRNDVVEKVSELSI